MAGSLTVDSGVFLGLYTLLLLIILFAAFTRQIKLKSRWGLVLFHVLLRVAAQSCGIVFGVLGFQAETLLIAYLALGAEGYFTLILCTTRFLITYHNHVLGDSWIEPRQPLDAPDGWFKRSFGFVSTARDPLTGRVQLSPKTGKPRRNWNWMGIVHWILITANALIIVGSAQLSDVQKDLNGISDEEVTRIFDTIPAVVTSKALRGAGQALFLVFAIALLVCIVITIAQVRTSGRSTFLFGHPVLFILLLSTPFLLVRGAFGVCQGVINDLNYYYPSIYDANGFTPDFVLKETLLNTMMEWIACALLVATWPVLRVCGYNSKRERAVPLVEKPIYSVQESADTFA